MNAFLPGFFRMVAGLALALGLILQAPDGAVQAQEAQDAPAGGQPGLADRPVVARTDSPRAVLTSFIALRDELEALFLAYIEEGTADAGRAQRNRERLGSLIDLSQVPEADRPSVGRMTVASLLDILGRVGVPNLDAVPDQSAFAETGLAAYRIPDTPLRIVRQTEGDRAGEFLFEARTVQVAPRFLEGIRDVPLRSRLPIRSWVDQISQVTGPWVPAALVAAMPASLRAPWHGVPIWKTAAAGLLSAIAAASVAVFYRWSIGRPRGSRVGETARRMLTPLLIVCVVATLSWFLREQLVLTGDIARWQSTLFLVVGHLGFAWLFWCASRLFFEWLILSPRIREGSLDADLLRLLAGLVGLTGAVVILAYAGHLIGLPVLSMVAGLGIGGLAVALAIRPTLENLVGGIILYIDKPVRVGDFCTFGDDMGTVEAIGVRSTQIRALDRTLISVPNAQFADMKLINWAHCDQMLILKTIGLRFETTPDQLRFLLVEMRKMLHAHPRIDSESVRVRYEGPGATSRDVTIRIYAQTADWNDFFAIREDVFLRIDDLVDRAGTAYALPSTTLYFRKDEGLDAGRQAEAEAEVETWRRTRRLPFPRLSEAQVAELRGTLDYPPRGSFETDGRIEPRHEAAERLSAEPKSASDGDPGTAEPEAERSARADRSR